MAWRYKDPMKTKWWAHKGNARVRNIPFLITFEEWRDIWLESGKWDQRGYRRGQYCMARYGDKGAYEVGNVRICLVEENHAERLENYYVGSPGELNPAYGKDYWASATPAEYARRAAGVSRQFAGKLKPETQKAKMSATATGRRKVTRNGKWAWAHPGDADFPALS
jgi:hypothetical protein